MKKKQIAIIAVLSITLVALYTGLYFLSSRKELADNKSKEEEVCNNPCGCEVEEIKIPSASGKITRIHVLEEIGTLSMEVEGKDTTVLIVDTTKIYDEKDKTYKASKLEVGNEITIEYEGIIESDPQQAVALTLKKSK